MAFKAKMGAARFERCPICGSVGPLRDSHVIPKFAYRWIKKTSATGKLKNAGSPDKRWQDGPHLPMLCGPCEGVLSRDETTFANTVFHSVQERTVSGEVNYDQWLLRLIVGVSFKATLVDVARFDQEAPGHGEIIVEALRSWSEFLRGKRVAPLGRHYMLRLPDEVFMPGQADVDRLHWYLDRATDQTLFTWTKQPGLYWKLPGMAFFSVFGRTHLPGCRSLQVRARRGTLDLDKSIESDELVSWLLDRRHGVGKVVDGMSESSWARIERDYMRNIESLVESPAGQTILKDGPPKPREG